MQLHEGMTLDNRYTILCALKADGAGTAYKAEDQERKCLCVIKEMPFPDTDDKIQIEFEAQLLIGLRHSNLPQVYDYFFEQKHLFLIREYVEG